MTTNRTSLWQSDTPHRIPRKEDMVLNADEQRQLADLQAFLRKAAKLDMLDQIGNGSINAAIKTCSPKVQEAVRLSQEFVTNFEETGGRKHLFDQRRELPEMDKETRAIASRAKTEDAIHSLNERMGTQAAQAEINERPADLREQLSAAFDTTNTEQE